MLSLAHLVPMLRMAHLVPMLRGRWVPTRRWHTQPMRDLAALRDHVGRKKIEFPRVTSHPDGKDRGKKWPACRPVEGRKRKKERKKKEKRRKGRRRG